LVLDTLRASRDGGHCRKRYGRRSSTESSAELLRVDKCRASWNMRIHAYRLFPSVSGLYSLTFFLQPNQLSDASSTAFKKDFMPKRISDLLIAATFILLCGSVARAESSCSAALSKFNALGSRHNRAYADAVMKEFGVPERKLHDPKTSEECRRWLPIYYRSKADYPSLKLLDHQVHSACGSTNRVVGTSARDLKDLSDSAGEAEQNNQRHIERCEEIIAKQMTAPSSVADGKRAPLPASCGSDITGTDNASTAANANDCKEAHRSLNAARQLRKQKQFSRLVPEEYKKAAAAAQRAGDTELMLKIIREAEQPDAPVADKPDPHKEGLVRSANAMSGAAQDLLSKPVTCGDMKDAEALYLSAAKNFLDADEIAKADEMTRKHTALVETVDRLETEGKCQVPQASAKQSLASTTNSQSDNTAKCQEALDRLKKLDEPTANMASIGEPADTASPRPNYNVVVAKMKLAAEGCNVPNARSYTLRECLAARLYMTQEGIAPNAISAIVEHAGCPK
jgi:hypothetical protein